VICFIHSQSYLDKSVSPCDNFYQFACGNFIQNNVVHDRYSKKNFQTGFKNQQDVDARNLLQGYTKNANIRPFVLANRFYELCIDQDSINRVGADDFLKKVKRTGDWPLLTDQWNEENFDWEEMLDRMFQEDFVDNYLIGIYLDVNPNNSSKHILKIGYPSAYDYWSKRSLPKVKPKEVIIESYLQYMKDFMLLLGIDSTKIDLNIKEILEFELAVNEVKAYHNCR